FFGPFYVSYVFFELEQKGYDYAFVPSHKKSYLWLLSRSPYVDQEVIDKFLQTARKFGFQTSDLIFVEQS
ncbi:MAG TPA: lipocalin, partial [Gammaproteobacteria bacterium]|nr:lipocalin [Gammaproteobacteria bacterium]